MDRWRKSMQKEMKVGHLEELTEDTPYLAFEEEKKGCAVM